MMGNGDKANGKLMVETLIENNTIGGNFIKYGFDLNILLENLMIRKRVGNMTSMII